MTKELHTNFKPKVSLEKLFKVWISPFYSDKYPKWMEKKESQLQNIYFDRQSHNVILVKVR